MIFEITIALFISLNMCFYFLLIKGSSMIPVLEKATIPASFAFPLLSIVVVACNEEKSIYDCIQNLKSQLYPNLEIILVNDRSTDNTGNIMNKVSMLDKRLRRIAAATSTTPHDRP